MLYRLVALTCLLVLAVCSHAAQIDFYRAVVPVESQTAKERSRAAVEGLKQVLIRVSGSAQVVDSPLVVEALSDSSKYLEQYHYQLDRLPNGDNQESLVMSYSQAHVRRILASESIWPTNRPKVLLWLVQDRIEEGKSFVSSIESPVTLGLQQTSETRGLPITFPLMDLDDRLALSVDQVWALDEKAVLEASERYRVDTILVGRYTETSQGKWWGTWQFFHRGQNRVYDIRAETGDELGAQGLAPLADYLARLYSVTTNAKAESQLYVVINQVEGFTSYKGVLNYLERLTVVSSFNLVSIEANEMLFGLSLAGSLSQFDNALALDKKIRPMPATSGVDASWLSVPEGTIDQPLRYLWVGE